MNGFPSFNGAWIPLARKFTLLVTAQDDWTYKINYICCNNKRYSFFPTWGAVKKGISSTQAVGNTMSVTLGYRKRNKDKTNVSYKVINTFWTSSKARSHKLSKQINVPKVTPKLVVKVVNVGWLGTSKMGSMNRFSFQCFATRIPDLSNTKFVLYMLNPSSCRHSV